MDAHSLNLPQEWLNQSIVCNRDEYVISYGQFGPCTFCHVTVEKWSPEVQKQMSDDIDILFYLHGGPVYAIAHDDKQKRFDALFGFEPTGVMHDGGEVLIKKE